MVSAVEARQPKRRTTFSPTSIYPQAVALSLRLRWVALLGGAVWVLLGGGRPVPSLGILMAVALYNVLLWRWHRGDRHPPLVWVAVLDLAALTGFLTLSPRLSSEAFLVFLFFVVVLTLAYGWWGALLSVAACVAGPAGVRAISGVAGEGLGAIAVVVAAMAVSAGALAFVVRRHEEVHGRLTRVTVHDRVTGLYNEQHFTEALDQLHRLSVRGSWPYALMVIDVDGLDRVNRARGRPAGDRVLRLIGQEIKAAVRGTDVVARIGADEFAVALPEADLTSAEHLGEKVRRRVSGLGENLTVTIGVTGPPSAQMVGAQETVKAAYRVMAAAKAQGGARVGTEAGGLPAGEAQGP